MLPEAFHDIPVERQRQTGSPGLCHLQTAELQHLPARLRAGLWPRGMTLGQNVYIIHRRSDQPESHLLEQMNSKHRNLDQHSLHIDHLVAAPQIYLFPRSNKFFQDLNYTSHLTPFTLAQVMFSSMYLHTQRHDFYFFIMHHFILYYLFCIMFPTFDSKHLESNNHIQYLSISPQHLPQQ